MSEIIRRIKRNPVVNIFILTAVGQFAHDYLAGTVTWDNIITYGATLVLGVIARMYVVPVEEHLDEVENAYMRGISTPRATPGIPFPEGGEK